MRSIHTPDYIEFVSRLRQARKAQRIKQEQLAERMGKPQSYISKAETCERRLDLLEAAEWCIALGIALEDVLPARLKASLAPNRKRSPSAKGGAR